MNVIFIDFIILLFLNLLDIAKYKNIMAWQYALIICGLLFVI